MARRSPPAMRGVTPLHRDDPDKAPLGGNVRVTRQDWLNVALDVLISDGADQVKVLALAERMGVSRSSFYWYFKSRDDLMKGLLDHWRGTNTAALVASTRLAAETVTAAVCNVFICFIDPARFNTRLDFAVRDWARRSGPIRHALDQSDEARLTALADMFARFGFPARESMTRARVLYYMQIGYNDADMQEDMQARLDLSAEYLLVFTGQAAAASEIEAFRAELVRLGLLPAD